MEDKVLRDQWIADLRSGEFKQGRSYLQKGDTYCCMGVLAKRLGVADLEVYSANSDHPGYKAVGRVIGDPDPQFASKSSIVGKLASMNDKDDTSFGEIADWIERNL